MRISDIDIGTCKTNSIVGTPASATLAAAVSGSRVVVISATIAGLTTDLKIGTRVVLSGGFAGAVDIKPVYGAWIFGNDNEALAIAGSGGAACVTWCYIPSAFVGATGATIA